MLLYSMTVLCVLISAIVNFSRTREGIVKGGRMFANLLPPLLAILAPLAIALSLLDPASIERWLGQTSGLVAYLGAALLGAVVMMPGFVAFPIAALLLNNGVAYPIIAVFVTSLMMVGVVTLPLERQYFGWRIALARNGLSFVGSLVIGVLMWLLWGML
ncbi:hypothetical protein Selin_2596 [Desulfurispirillum indicum S5]|uniref:Permease n=1 Tax=Desulfurispirillum indicum (strain ATCC BAA-1389 / DSM 22839 / S5) TaxID=653733 RepID=E6W6H2_DESIS|nr:hypothetical protein [Desulfurispirillum indicum]ADU67307.1 hypothetical protein Selin_2596 [Desulfurispirillum indicum S5]